MENMRQEGQPVESRFELGRLGTVEGAKEAIACLAQQVETGRIPAAWELRLGEVVMTLPDTQETLERFRRRAVQEEQLPGLPINPWYLEDFATPMERLAVAEALHAAGKEIRSADLAKLRERAGYGRESQLAPVEAPTPISVPVQAFLGAFGEKKRRGCRRVSWLIAGTALTVAGVMVASDALDKRQQILALTSGGSGVSQEVLEDAGDVNQESVAPQGEDGFAPTALPQNPGDYDALVPLQEGDQQLELVNFDEDEYTFAGVRFAAPLWVYTLPESEQVRELEDYRITLRFAFNAQGEELAGIPGSLELSFLPSPYDGEGILKEECLPGSKKACTYGYEGGVVLVPHSGYSGYSYEGIWVTDAGEPLESEALRSFLEGDQPFERLPIEEQKRRFGFLRRASVSLQTKDGSVEGLRVVWAGKIPHALSADFERNVEGMSDFVASNIDPGLGEILQEGERYLAIPLCGWFDGEGEPGERSWYRWSWLYVIVGR